MRSTNSSLKIGPLLISLLVASSVFQAASVFNIKFNDTYYPILPFYFIESFIFISSFYAIVIGRKTVIFSRSGIHLSFIVLAIFVLYSVVTVVSLPMVFASLPVYNPRLGLDVQYNNLTPLSFSLSMLGQIGYLILNSITFLYIINIKIDYFDPEKINRILIYVILFVVFIGIWQFVHKTMGIYFPNEIIYSSLGRSQGYNQRIAGFQRINSTFTEPSVLAVFLLSSLAYLMRVLANRLSLTYVMIITLVFVLLLMTTSGTAYLGLIILLLALMLDGLYRILLKKAVVWRVLIFGSFSLLVIIISFVVLYYFSSDVRDLIALALTKKDQSISFVHRIAADRAAIKILFETYGLGVGLGGNRPSSFITYLLSNVGFIGSFLFLLFLTVLLHRAIIIKRYLLKIMDNKYIYIDATIWAVTFCVIGMAIAVPDLSYPVFWMWLYILAFFISRFSHRVKFNE